MVKIAIAALDGCLGSAFLGLADLFALAARAIVATTATDTPPYLIVTGSPSGGPVRDGSGVILEVGSSLEAIAACDAVIVPSFAPDPAGNPPDMGAFASAAAWLRRHHARGALIAGSGSGAFLLGAAGLLDGRRCTTSWRHFEELKARFPRADAAWGARLIEDRRVVTAAGPLSWIEVGMHVLHQLCGPEVGRIAADVLLSEKAPERGGAVRHASDGAENFVAEAERIVRRSDTAFTAQDLARALSTSERTLHRKLRRASGESPKAFIDRIRFDTARTLLETSSRSVKELAASAGFVDEASFRRAFRRFAGMAPSAYRTWARARSQSKAQMFALRKDSELIPEMLTRILDSCVNGVTLADPDLEDSPIVYANRQFVEITGYPTEEIIGRNCRFLQGNDRDQEGLRRLRDAIRNREAAEVTLRNYRRGGALFHNRLSVTPLFDADGRLLYFLGVQYDVSQQVRAETEIGDLKAKLLSLAG